MFDIGFFEIVVVMVVMLIVIGPERLPKVARTAGLWLGRARSVIQTVKADIDRELAAEELKRTLQQQAQQSGIHEIIEETEDLAAEMRQPLTLDEVSRDSITDDAPAGQDPKPAATAARVDHDRPS